MTTSVGSNLGIVLREAFTLANALRSREEEEIRRALVADPEVEERRQREFESSLDTFGIFPRGRGIRIA